MLPTRPSAMLVLMASGVPPQSQSLSVRFGKPRLPPPSDAWHWAQLLRNSFCPVFIAFSSFARAARSCFAQPSYSGPNAASAALFSSSSCFTCVQPSIPA